jgi:hypothetical protein
LRRLALRAAIPTSAFLPSRPIADYFSASMPSRRRLSCARSTYITGLDVKDAAEWLQESLAPAATVPQKTEARKQLAPPSKAFDPVAFAAKLVFSEEVKALGLNEEDAERFGVGFYRGKVYLPMRDANGFVAGFVGYANGELKMPPQWLPSPTNVVPIRRPA